MESTNTKTNIGATSYTFHITPTKAKCVINVGGKKKERDITKLVMPVI
jgi:hypothetical protein